MSSCDSSLVSQMTSLSSSVSSSVTSLVMTSSFFKDTAQATFDLRGFSWSMLNLQIHCRVSTLHWKTSGVFRLIVNTEDPLVTIDWTFDLGETYARNVCSTSSVSTLMIPTLFPQPTHNSFPSFTKSMQQADVPGSPTSTFVITEKTVASCRSFSFASALNWKLQLVEEAWRRSGREITTTQPLAKHANILRTRSIDDWREDGIRFIKWNKIGK